MQTTASEAFFLAADSQYTFGMIRMRDSTSGAVIHHAAEKQDRIRDELQFKGTSGEALRHLRRIGLVIKSIKALDKEESDTKP